MFKILIGDHPPIKNQHYLIISEFERPADELLSPDEVVKAYFEKDFVEKVFRTLKTSEEMEPASQARSAG